MEHPVIQIKNALVGILKGIDPGVDIYVEEIKSTNPSHGASQILTWYFIDLTPGQPATVDGLYTDMGILVDIAYHEKEESNTRYLVKAAELDAAIRPVLAFGDRKITIHEADIKVVDHVLHYGFRVNFRHSTEPAVENDRMAELGVSFKKESETV